MKKILLLLLLVSGFAHAQIIDIPDANFKAKLLEASTENNIAKDLNNQPLKIDMNENGEIEIGEALQVSHLNMQVANIYNVVGLENFINLVYLNFTNNNISSINLTNLINLQKLFIAKNDLTLVDFSTLINLETLNCDDNELITLDLNNLSSLEFLYANVNELTSISFNSSANLKEVELFANNLTSLDFSGFPTLLVIQCSNNSLTTLNVNNLVNLQALLCAYNQLSSIDLSGLSSLFSFQGGTNLFTSLDLSDQSSLSYLGCENNLLSTIDFSPLNQVISISVGNPGLNTLNFATLNNPDLVTEFKFSGGNQTLLDLNVFPNVSLVSINYSNLTSLELSENTELNILSLIYNADLTYVNLKNGKTEILETFLENPNVIYVCADEEQVSSLQDIVGSNTMVSSYCNFTPGGNYNTITGSILYDFDNNGCDDNDAQPFIKMNINDGIEQGSSFADSEGNYTFYTQEGNFTVTPQLENPAIFTVAPLNATVIFPLVDDSVSTNNFCITPNGVHPDLEVVIAPLVPARPGFDAVYEIVYKNKGNQTVDGYVNFTYNETVLDFVSSSVIPLNQADGYMNWVVLNIAPFQSGSIIVTLNVNSPQETPAVNIDDVLAFNAFIDVSTDDTWADNNFDFSQIVVGSYDPNDIICLQGDNALPSEIGNYLHYIVNFENTGTAPAENVVVKVDIDETKYDVSSLQILNGSHPLEAKVSADNVAEFIFKAINLDTNGHGNILLKMKTKQSLNEGDTVTKKANIYFDYNFPILTNDANTTFQDLSVGEHLKDHSIKVYPNPTQNLVKFEADSTIHSIELYDIQGRLLLTHLSSETNAMLDISDKANGVYFFKIKSEKGIKVEKIIKK